MDIKKIRILTAGIPKSVDLTDSNVLQTFQLQIVNAGVTASKPLKLDADKKLTSGNIDLSTEVTGTLPIANGGTNSTTALNNNRVMASSGGAIVEAAAITASRALVSDSNGIPTHSTTTSTEIGYVAGVTSGIQSQLDAKVDDSEKGAALGVATLDAGGKIPATQLPNSVMEYKGTWAASTNTPTLANGTGNAGDVYVASDAGTVDFGAGNITFATGDWVIYSGSIWEKSINSNAVASVNGYTGAVTLVTDDIAEDGTPVNLWFTATRAKTAAVVNTMAGSETDQAPSVSSVKTYIADNTQPANKFVYSDALLAGEGFDANKTYAVRWALDGETAGRVYKADKDEETKPGQYWARGVIQTTSALSAGDAVGQVLKIGRITLKSGDTNVASTANGKPLFLQNAGAMTEVDPATGVTTGNEYASVICGSVVSYNATVTSTIIEINLAGNPLVGIDIA